MSLASLATLILGILKAAPMLDRWAQEAFVQYKEFKKGQDTAQLQSGISDAEKKDDTKKLQDLLNKDLQ